MDNKITPALSNEPSPLFERHLHFLKILMPSISVMCSNPVAIRSFASSIVAAVAKVIKLKK